MEHTIIVLVRIDNVAPLLARRKAQLEASQEAVLFCKKEPKNSYQLAGLGTR
jgi:hypothetical protein